MLNLFIVIFLLTPFLGMYFLVRKQQFNQLTHRELDRKQIFGTFIAILIGSFIGIGIFADPVEPTETTIQAEETLVNSPTPTGTPAPEPNEPTADTPTPEVQTDTTRTEKTVSPSPSPSPTPTPRPTATPRPTPAPTPRPTPKPATPPPTLNPIFIPPPTPVPAPATTSYGCNCSKTCGAMSSCDEAYYQLNTCGCGQRDGDNDGVPCESICPGG